MYAAMARSALAARRKRVGSVEHGEHAASLSPSGTLVGAPPPTRMALGRGWHGLPARMRAAVGARARLVTRQNGATSAMAPRTAIHRPCFASDCDAGDPGERFDLLGSIVRLIEPGLRAAQRTPSSKGGM